MGRDLVMILEDDDQRAAWFEVALQSVGRIVRLRVWRDAPTMIEEATPLLGEACLISLDHDLIPLHGASCPAGCGMDVTQFLAEQQPVCPVVVHTSNFERGGIMQQVLSNAGWQVERVIPGTEDWIWTKWLPRAQKLLLLTGGI